MMIVAGCAVVFNIVLALVLHGPCNISHSHSHGGNASSNKLLEGPKCEEKVRHSLIVFRRGFCCSFAEKITSIITFFQMREGRYF